MKQIRALPIVEKWDCHGCSHCCRATTIQLDQEDLQQLQRQKWEEHPDFQGRKTVQREHPLSRRRVLAKQPDGSCIFLNDAGRCLIHERFGAAAKPKICRLFPLQVVPLGDFSLLTARRSCPSAAADRGRPVSQHLAELKKSGILARSQAPRKDPPKLGRQRSRDWSEFLAAADTLAGLVTDTNLPRVRTIVHGLRFCDLLESSKTARVKAEDWKELMQLLAQMAPEDAGAAFRDRQPPSRGANALFRQLAVHYLRAHPRFQMTVCWRERWRLLRAMSRFARGKGQLPPLPMEFPSTTFEDLQRPLGPLPDDVSRPLNRFIETHVVSKQYVVAVPGTSLTQSFRGLAVTYAMGLWLLRLTCGEREPTVDDMVEVVVTLERGQGVSSLTRAASAMAATDQLEPLIAWYAR